MCGQLTSHFCARLPFIPPIWPADSSSSSNHDPFNCGLLACYIHTHTTPSTNSMTSINRWWIAALTYSFRSIQEMTITTIHPFSIQSTTISSTHFFFILPWAHRSIPGQQFAPSNAPSSSAGVDAAAINVVGWCCTPSSSSSVACVCFIHSFIHLLLSPLLAAGVVNFVVYHFCCILPYCPAYISMSRFFAFSVLMKGKFPVSIASIV